MSTATEHLLLLIKEIENQCKVDEAATILVSREKSEVITVGLQCDEPNYRVILTIAANDSIQAQTISHAETIWNCLQEHGNDCHRIQQQNVSPEMVGRTASGQSTQAKIIQIKQRVYQFPYPKLLSCFNKEKSPRRFNQVEDVVEKLPNDFPKMTSLLASAPAHTSISPSCIWDVCPLA